MYNVSPSGAFPFVRTWEPRRGACAAGALAFCTTFSAFAQQPAPSALAPIVVTAPTSGLDAPVSTGSNLGLTPLETPASVESISRAQIRERGDTNVLDAVTRAAGISAMAHPGNGMSSLSARGLLTALRSCGSTMGCASMAASA